MKAGGCSVAHLLRSGIFRRTRIFRAWVSSSEKKPARPVSVIPSVGPCGAPSRRRCQTFAKGPGWSSMCPTKRWLCVAAISGSRPTSCCVVSHRRIRKPEHEAPGHLLHSLLSGRSRIFFLGMLPVPSHLFAICGGGDGDPRRDSWNFVDRLEDSALPTAMQRRMGSGPSLEKPMEFHSNGQVE